MHESIADGIEMQTDIAAEVAASVRSPELQPVARDFARSCEQLLELLALPLVLLTYGESQTLTAAFHVLVENDRGLPGWGEEAVRAYRAALRRAADRQLAEFPVANHALEALRKLLKEPVVASAFRSMLFAALSGAWAAFESVAKDCWVVALNLRTDELGRRALTKLPQDQQDGGVSSKQISVEIMARYGFDLRNKLGTVLEGKFDFTSVSGIRRAYTTAFDSFPTDLSAWPDDLSVLEATRHLIVHRAGYVDRTYAKRTGYQGPDGEPLDVSGSRVCKLADVAILAGCDLVRGVDDWLGRHAPSLIAAKD